MNLFADRSKSLHDAFYELSLSGPKPDAKVLDELARKYPEHAEALTSFAIELALDSSVPAGDSEERPTTVAVSKAMSRFHNRLYALQHADKQENFRAAPTESPFSSLDRSAFRALSKRLNVNSVFLQKVRDRHIEESTISEGFCRLLSAELGTTPQLMTAYLLAPAQVSPDAYYKADQKPNVGPKQSFEEAVRSSGLSVEQQAYLLSL